MNKNKIAMAREFLDCLESGEEGWFWGVDPLKAVKRKLEIMNLNSHCPFILESENASYANFSKTKPQAPITITIKSCCTCPHVSITASADLSLKVPFNRYDCSISKFYIENPIEIHPECPLRGIDER